MKNNSGTRKRLALNTKDLETGINSNSSPKKPIRIFFQIESTARTILQRLERIQLSVPLTLLFLFIVQFRLHSLSVYNDRDQIPYETTSDKFLNQGLSQSVATPYYAENTFDKVASTIEQPKPELSYHVTRDNLQNESLKQKIVILSGPHKNIISSIKKNMKSWENSENSLRPEWKWLVPQLVTEIETKYDNHSSNGFNALLESIYDSSAFGKIAARHVIKLYRTEFLKAWVKGYNIVVGSERMNFFINNSDGPQVINDLIDLMPWHFDDEIYIDGSNKSLEVVVMYQGRRLDHLISIWNDNRKKDESFKDWVVNIDKAHLKELDSLWLVELLINEGLNVVVVDISGVEERDLNVANVAACNIFFGNCDTNKELMEMKIQPIQMDTKEAYTDGSLSREKLTKINTILKVYDCQYNDMLKSKRITLRQNTELDKNHPNCDGIKERIAITELKTRLGCVALSGDDCPGKLGSESEDMSG